MRAISITKFCPEAKLFLFKGNYNCNRIVRDQKVTLIQIVSFVLFDGCQIG